MYFPNNLRSDHLPWVRDAFAAWNDSANNCEVANRNWPNGTQTKIHSSIYLRNPIDWRPLSNLVIAKRRGITMEKFWLRRVKMNVLKMCENSHTSLISETGNLSFLRGCLSNTYRRLGHSRSGRLATFPAIPIEQQKASKERKFSLDNQRQKVAEKIKCHTKNGVKSHRINIIISTASLTCQADFREMDAVWHEHEYANALGSGLFAC